MPIQNTGVFWILLRFETVFETQQEILERLARDQEDDLSGSNCKVYNLDNFIYDIA